MRALARLGLTVLVLTACSADPEPRDDDLREPASTVEFGVYLPDLDGARPAETVVGHSWISTTFERDGGYAFTLVQLPDPSGRLCQALRPHRLAGDSCRVRAGVAVTSMEEMSGVAVVRADTVLYATSLVTEANPDLLSRAEEALLTAEPADLRDLGRTINAPD